VPDNKDRKLGARLRTLTHIFTRQFLEETHQAGLDEASITHGWIIGFLYDNSHRDIYQRDLEEIFHMTRSSVSDSLKLMEKRGYLTRERVEGDARLKKLVLTPQGIAFQEKTVGCFHRVEARALAGIPQEDIDTFFAVGDAIRENLLPRKECGVCENTKNYRLPD
jgi:DNA-binding MarR family transcriptional regulator